MPQHLGSRLGLEHVVASLPHNVCRFMPGVVDGKVHGKCEAHRSGLVHHSAHCAAGSDWSTDWRDFMASARRIALVSCSTLRVVRQALIGALTLASLRFTRCTALHAVGLNVLQDESTRD